MNDLRVALQRYFGFSAFRPGQEAVIRGLLSGKNVLAVLPTGQGKSLTYQLPTLMTGQLTIVVSPLLALMNDQVQHLQEMGVKRAVALNSMLERQEQLAILNHLDRWQFIFVAPETLSRPDVLTAFAHFPIGLFVVDEAHCISEWGPDFRPAFLQLGTIIQRLQPRRILALTATAAPRVQDDIKQRLGLSPATTLAIVHSVNRPNIWLDICPINDEQEKLTVLRRLLRIIPGSVIVYFNRKKRAREVAAALAADDIAVGLYHGDLDPLSRRSLQNQFLHGRIRVICATVAFGMGIDKNDVRAVIHFAPPSSLAGYLQAIGRAGRDNLPAAAISLVGPGDIPQMLADAERGFPSAGLIQTFFADPSQFQHDESAEIVLLRRYQHFASAATVQTLLQNTQATRQAAAQQMARFFTAPATVCRRQLIVNAFDPHPMTVRHDAHCCAVTQPPQLFGQLSKFPWPALSPSSAALTPSVLSVAVRLKKLFPALPQS